jgi:sortase B
VEVKVRYRLISLNGRRLDVQKPNNGKKPVINKKLLLRAAMFLCACVAVGCILYLGRYYYYVFAERSQQKELNELFEYAVHHNPAPTAAPTQDSRDGRPEQGEWQRERQRLYMAEHLGYERFADLLEINPDFRGRVSIPGLLNPLIYVISHDNDEYLITNFEGKPSPLGTIFLDARNDPLLMDRNSTLTGHNMNTGDMFAPIMKYKRAETFDTSPLIVLEGLPEDSAWIVFAAYESEPYWGFCEPSSEENYGQLLAEIAARNWFITDVEVTEDDRILTLVTCDYSYEDMRFIVHARKLRPGELPPESVEAVKNPERKPFNVPSQMRLSEITPSRTAVLIRPGNNRLYFYQPRDGGIDWYSGNTTTVQGIYSNFTGKITGNSYLAAVYDGSEKRSYLAADNFSGQKEIYLFSAHTPAGKLTSNGRVTPYGVNAKFPALVHENGATWLFYTVPANDSEKIYRLKIKNRKAEGPPELLRELPAGTGARPLGQYAVGDSFVLFWHETASKKVYGAWEGGDAFETRLPGDAVRVTVYGTASGGILRYVLERNGNLSFHTFDLSALPPKPALPEPEENPDTPPGEPEDLPEPDDQEPED